MSEYWMPVNLDRKEYLTPHRFGDGLGLSQWNCDGQTATWKAISELWGYDDTIVAASDSGRHMHLQGRVSYRSLDELPTYDDLAEPAEGYKDVSAQSAWCIEG